METVEQKKKVVFPKWVLNAIRVAPIACFFFLAVCLFAFYAAPTMTFLGEKGENIYELVKLEEPFAENLITLGCVTVGVALLSILMFILPQTGDREYFAVWLHEIVAAISSVLYISLLVQICRGIKLVKELEMRSGAGLVLPLVFIILFLIVNVTSVVLWRIFNGEGALKEGAKEKLSSFAGLEKPEKVPKPLARMPLNITRLTKLYEKKCLYVIWMCGILVMALTILLGLLICKCKNGLHPIYALGLDRFLSQEQKRTFTGEEASLLPFTLFVYILAVALSLIIVFIANLYYQATKQKRFWKFKQDFFKHIQIVFTVSILVVVACIYFIYIKIPSVSTSYEESLGGISESPKLITKTAGWSDAFTVIVVFAMLPMEIVSIVLQRHIRRIKKTESFTEDILFYENNFYQYSQSYRQYCAELRAYKLKKYCYRRAQVALA